MNSRQMQQKIDSVLEQMDAAALEERIAPVDCTKKPNHPDCQPVTMYGVSVSSDAVEADPDMVTRYGIPDATN